MWFKNLQIYRLPAPWAFNPEQMEEALQPQAFTPCATSGLTDSNSIHFHRVEVIRFAGHVQLHCRLRGKYPGWSHQLARQRRNIHDVRHRRKPATIAKLPW